jgi:predicted MFS family arabinose efflux permease
VLFRSAAGTGAALASLWRSPPLRSMLVLGSVLVAADSAWFALLVLYTTQELALPAAAYGVLLAVGAAGGVVGGLLAARLADRFGRGVALLAAVGVAASTQVALGLTAEPVLAAVLLLGSSFAFAVWNVTSVSARQRLVPAGVLGRVVGAYRTCTMSAAAVGAVLGGIVAAGFGLRAPFLAGGLLLLAALAGTGRPLLRALD